MMTNSLELNWKKHYTLQESAVSTLLQAWLLYSGSFMQRLSDVGVAEAKIHVVSEAWQRAEPWENALLKIEDSEHALVREVLIVSQGKYWMFARSVFPASLLTGKEADLAHLETRPLGTVLFNHPDMKRGDFLYLCLHPGMPWHHRVIDTINDAAVTHGWKDLWARYSLFHLGNKELLLTEIFLPDITEAIRVPLTKKSDF